MIAPLAVALAVLAIVRLAFAERTILGGAAVAVGFLLGYALFEGVPPFPPPAGKQKIFYLVLIGGGLGLALDLARSPAALTRGALLVLPGAALAWLAWRQIMAGPEALFWLHLALLWLGFAAVLWRLDQVARSPGGTVPAAVLLCVTAAGASGVAYLGASITMALLLAALAAPAGALLAWSYGERILNRDRHWFGAAALLGGGGALVALAAVLSLYTPQVSRTALVLLALVPFSSLLVERFSPGGEGVRRLGLPWLVAVAAAVTALVAVGAAYVARTA